MRKENTPLIREMQAEIFQKQGEGWFRIVSGSMRPLIDVGDRIFAKRVSAVEIKPRDIHNTTKRSEPYSSKRRNYGCR